MSSFPRSLELQGHRAGVPPSYGTLPPGLQGRNLSESKYIPIIVEGGTVADDTGIITLIFDGKNDVLGHGVGAVATRLIRPGDAVCTTINLPSANYSGLAPSFYGLQSRIVDKGGSLNITASANDETDDEIDFEFLGAAESCQTMFRLNGTLDNANEGPFDVPDTRTDTANGTTGGVGRSDVNLCFYWNSTDADWYFNNKLQRTEPITLHDMFAWFSIWDTTTSSWDCCGPLTTTETRMYIKRFSIYSTDPHISDLPPEVVAAMATTTATSAVATASARVNTRVTTASSRGATSAGAKDVTRGSLVMLLFCLLLCAI